MLNVSTPPTQLEARSALVRTAYWTATGLVTAVFLSSGAMYVLGVEAPVRGVLELGYPRYFVTLLGAAKLLGALTIALPRLPRLKEWAYAGIAIDLVAAAVSYAAVGRAAKALVPLAFLGVALLSWWLRPGARRQEDRQHGL